MDPLELAAAVRNACVTAALDGYERAQIAGLCQEGAWECAIDAMRIMDLTPIVGATAPPRDRAGIAGYLAPGGGSGLARTRQVQPFNSTHRRPGNSGSIRNGRRPFQAAGQSPKEKPMSFKLATPIARNGNPRIEADPFWVNFPVSRGKEFTRTHFGLDQTTDVTDGPEVAILIPGLV